ncbi:MAG: tRNA (guanine-N(7)-)-methyltransferase (tRNA(m7G46)-methyltransferase) [Watsoniomyces obsoletus]|nr:MAG: tRNA (guanine-N(7)-)-methyltransferase (tRNA(m7G46)-methyltransferase) [Watsoniomyces obsoletus]
MPTPTHGTPLASSPSNPYETASRWMIQSSCPPALPVPEMAPSISLDDQAGHDAQPQTPPPHGETRTVDVPEHEHQQSPSSTSNHLECSDDLSSAVILSPMSSTSEAKDSESLPALPEAQRSTMSTAQSHEEEPLPFDVTYTRLRPNYSSSFLRPGSRFQGTQKSESEEYAVNVEIKHVDMDESFLCGYLRIQGIPAPDRSATGRSEGTGADRDPIGHLGLTKDHPSLTTYFEAEIVGDKYSFYTQHPEWGSNDRIDVNHWSRFGAWRPYAKAVRKPDFTVRNFAQKEYLFMRWKEQFVVPDHRVRALSGASYDGFYYVCFNQTNGAVKGVYFHARSEK